MKFTLRQINGNSFCFSCIFLNMADFSELFRTTEEQLTPLDAKIEGKVMRITVKCLTNFFFKLIDYIFK